MHQTLYGFEPLDESMWVPEYDVWSTTPPPDPNATTTVRKARGEDEKPVTPPWVPGGIRLTPPSESTEFPKMFAQYMTGSPVPIAPYAAPTTPTTKNRRI